MTLLPGASGSADFWAPMIAQLPAAWRARAFDLPGLGSVPAEPDVSSYDDLVDYIARRLAAPTAVVAQSMGAYIGLQLTLRHPELVTHLVLVAATGGIDVARHGAAEWRSEYLATYPDAEPWARARVPDLTEQLSAITTPVLLMWPTHDIFSPLTVAHALASRIHSPSLVTFDSSDHWIVRQFPKSCADAISGFIRRYDN